MNNKVVVILGATSTGKSSLGIELANILDGEIISGDSVLVYKGLDIGSAKPTHSDLEKTKHHMIDILEPEDSFDVTYGKQLIEDNIKIILSRGKVPIIVGGTGLYIKAFLENYSFVPVSEDAKLRKELEMFAVEHGKFALHQRLQTLDANAASTLHPNDSFRVIRAIEIALNGCKKEQALAYNGVRKDFNIIVYGLSMARDLLYNRINSRVDNMLENGLENEVRNLLNEGVPSNAQSLRSIGYKQMVEFIEGRMDKETCINKIKQATRNFAKRQVTFFKAMPYIKWLEIDNNSCLHKIALELAREVQKYED